MFEEGQEQVGELPRNSKNIQKKDRTGSLMNASSANELTSSMKQPSSNSQDSNLPFLSQQSVVGGVGKMEIKIVRGLLYKNTEMFGKMDPFIQLEYNKIKMKTQTVDEGGETPVWDHTFNLDIITMTEEDHVTLTCWEEDFLSNDFIGETILKVRYLKEQSGK